ncbi:MAG TPA: universal stress protein [Thiobacillus sp.]|jgi:hypothetical protein|nr:universal stress protein [Thiobacillus sp.]
MRDMSEQLAHRSMLSYDTGGRQRSSKISRPGDAKSASDLIVLGPGSTSLVRRALLGSVAQRVLQTAACDVLICHPQGVRE